MIVLLLVILVVAVMLLLSIRKTPESSSVIALQRNGWVSADGSIINDINNVISFDVKTNDATALLFSMFGTGNSNEFLSIRIKCIDGFVNVNRTSNILDGRTIELRDRMYNDKRVNDGLWHRVIVTISNVSISISVDEHVTHHAITYRFPSRPTTIYFGGDKYTLSQLYGCMRNVTINGKRLQTSDITYVPSNPQLSPFTTDCLAAT